MWNHFRYISVLTISFCCGLSAQQTPIFQVETYDMPSEQTESRAEKECMVYIARAFCRDNQGGNPAGVVLEQELTTGQMQAMAKELNFSETIFLTKTGPTLYKAVYFTPNSPIDFCGHATIAAFGVLKQIHHLKSANYQVETPIGICEVNLSDSLIYLSQSLPVFGQVIPAEEIAPVLGISASDIESTHLKPQIVSTGLRDIFVPVTTQDCLFALQPNHEQITTLSEKYDVIGLHVFSLEFSEKEATAFCRNFAPRYAIPEESATGSSNGALGCYLSEQDVLKPGDRHTLLFKQGDVLNAPSNIYVRLIVTNERIEKVECGGEVIIDEMRTLQLLRP